MSALIEGTRYISFFNIGTRGFFSDAMKLGKGTALQSKSSLTNAELLRTLSKLGCSSYSWTSDFNSKTTQKPYNSSFISDEIFTIYSLIYHENSCKISAVTASKELLICKIKSTLPSYPTKKYPLQSPKHNRNQSVEEIYRNK